MFKIKFKTITAINARIYKIKEKLNLVLSTLILAIPIATKYPTAGDSADTSCKIPVNSVAKNIKKTIKETNIALRFKTNPSKPIFLR